MNLFGGGGNKPDAEKIARDEMSQKNILAGGLPLNAIDRLQEQASRQGTPQHLFTSDFSANELMLSHEYGFVPLGQVMGSCVYNVGWQYMPTTSWVYASGELAVLSESQFNARQLAFSRLRQEAKLLKADGVVGVRFTRQESEMTGEMIEFMAIGTAVRRIGAPPITEDEEPFVSNLSGQDHWMLRKGGYKPVGFAFGNCAWYQYPDWKSQSAMYSWSNAELTSVSQGLYTAREVAMDRLEAEARHVAADGIVGVTYDTSIKAVEIQNSPPGFIMHFTAWGTAIAREDQHSAVANVTPYVSLSDA